MSSKPLCQIKVQQRKGQASMNWLPDGPISPFNHQASFIQFPSTPIRHCHTNTIARKPKPSHTFTGARCLARSMGQRVELVDNRKACLIRADALTYIEKLTLGKAVTRRPRNMHPLHVNAKLQEVIPQKHFVSYKVAERLMKTEGWRCVEDALARAAAEYISFLKVKGGRSGERKDKKVKSCEVKTPKLDTHKLSVSGGDQVEKFLNEIDELCNKWLADRAGRKSHSDKTELH